MNAIPAMAEPILTAFAPAMTEPTFRRFCVLVAAAILCRGRHTITRMVWLIGPSADGDVSDYHRVLSRAPWNYGLMTRALAAMVLDLVPKGQPVVVAIDDTTVQHKGKRIFGKDCHRDAVASSHEKTRFVYGHKWVVLSVLARLPMTARPWALPILTKLYRSPKSDVAEGRKHRTTIELAECMIGRLLSMFRDRTLVFLGDGGFSAHRLARFCAGSHGRVVLVSRFYPDANLYDPPGIYAGVGRPRVKGDRLPRPREAVANMRLRRATVAWYGAKRRRIELASQVGHWYRAGEGLVPVRWVFVRDLEGARREEYFYTTDVTMRPARIVELYAMRWNLEVTFQEAKEHLGMGSPRNWCKRSVLRSGPCLLMLYSLVALIYHRLCTMHTDTAKTQALRPCTAGYEKRHITFSDALATVRGEFWTAWLLEHGPPKRPWQNNESSCINKLIHRLSHAL